MEHPQHASIASTDSPAISRRAFCASLAFGATTMLRAAAPEPFRLRYILSSAMYGEMPLEVILPEVAKTGCEAIDIWCRVHGTQREQITEMGDDAFAALLKKRAVKLGVSTRYPPGPFGLQEEMAWLKKFGGKVIVTGSKGPREPQGAAARTAVLQFLEDMNSCTRRRAGFRFSRPWVKSPRPSTSRAPTWKTV